ncbi:hypothetical protein KBA41_08685 [Candidatus Ozemobacteraceae bacterium]|nr:hypothetical protein [Candidatus Ozemobacteraceae bacterium]
MSQPTPARVLLDHLEDGPATTSDRSRLRYVVSSIAGIIFLYSIASGRFSVDGLCTSPTHVPAAVPRTASESHGLDWKVIDGVRWIRVTGTDSAGIGYNGWISELFIKNAPPEPSSETNDIMEKIGLPSMKEKLEGARQLRKVGKALEQALSKD